MNKIYGAVLMRGVLFAFFLFASQLICADIVPDFYSEPGLFPNREYVNQHFGEHIDPFNGALEHHYVDLYLPGGGGFDLKILRSYNSSLVAPFNPAKQVTPIGPGWDLHFGRVLTTSSGSYCLFAQAAFSTADNPILELPDGSRQILLWDGTYTGSVPNVITTQRYKLVCNSDKNVTVYSPDGLRYDMTQSVSFGSSSPYIGLLATKITDRNGNYATISYYGAGSRQITSVTTNDGRSVTFNYVNNGQSNSRITSFTDGVRTISYTYQLVSGYADTYNLIQVTRPDGASWQYTYNGIANFPNVGGGYLMNQLTAPYGGSISYSYTPVKFYLSGVVGMEKSNAITQKTTSDGGVWTYSYTPSASSPNFDMTVENGPTGTIIYKHYGYGTVTSGTVWQVGLLASKQWGSNKVETYTWTGQQVSPTKLLRPGSSWAKFDNVVNAPLLASKVVTLDGQTYSTTYSGFDSYGNPASMVETGPNGGSRSTTLTYNINASKWIINQLKNENFTGGSTIRTFDSNGNPTSINKDGVTTNYTYHSDGNIASITYPRGLVHNFSNYKRGIPRTENQPEGIVISRVVSDAGNVTSETNGNGKTTTYGYDLLNRLTSIGYPTGNIVSITYTTTKKTATRGLLSEVTNYDGFYRPTSISLGGIARTSRYDAAGRKSFESNPGSAAGTTFLYDVLNRVTKQTYADGKYKTFAYGAGSRTVTDENGKATTYKYRSYGDPSPQFLMSVTAPVTAANVTISRNARDLVTAVTQGGLTRTYGYNSNYYLTSVGNPETGTTTFGRDAAGNMTSRSVGASGSTSYTYDNQNRLTGVVYPGATPAVSMTYSKTHKLLSVTSSVASKAYTYDSNDNLINEAQTISGNVFSTSYGYNTNDQLSSITYPKSARVVSFSPDVLGRPTQASGYATAVSYWPSGQVKQINYNNGTVTNYGQNARLWPSSFSTQQGANTYINSSHTYDGVGNLTVISDAVDGAYNRALSYDNINRLTGINGPWGSGTIAYSGGGNITSQTFGPWSTTYSYDASNRLSALSGSLVTSFSYDAYGNIVGGSGKTYTYDGAPNLQCVNCADPVNKIEYAYDGLNQRVAVTKAGVKTYEVYGPQGNLLAEYTPSQSDKLVEYIYLGGKRIAQRVSDSTVSSSTLLGATPNPASVGQSVTLTAGVTGSNPTGTVTFKDGAITLGTAGLTGGQANLSVSFASAGSHSLTADYSGDANNASSVSPAVSLTVNAKTATTTTLTVEPNPAPENGGVVLAVTVTGNNPTGTVTIKDGTTTLGTAPLTAGIASYVTSFTTTGDHSLTAIYGGDLQNLASTSPAVVLAINPLVATTTSLDVTPNPAKVGQTINLTATVTGSTPSGVVTFMDAGIEMGTANLSNGLATYLAIINKAGDHGITAVYGGDSYNSGSTSSVVNLRVDVPIETLLPAIMLLLGE